MIKVLLADDSAFLKKVLQDALESTGRVQVVGSASNGKEAIELVKRLNPDVAVLDCEMPVMNGLEALRRIMQECPLPVFVFSSLSREGSSVTIKALELGAIDYLQKPSSTSAGIPEIAGQLVRKIESVALRGRFMKMNGRLGPKAGAPAAPAAVRRPASGAVLPRKKIDLIAIGSSTGGVQAGMRVVPNIAAGSPPVVWVQHMPASFTTGFAARVNQASQIEVKEAEDGDRLESGYCYLAPGGFQMRVARDASGFYLKVGGTEKRTGFCPSCDVLFESVSEHFTGNSLGVILTGMGNDGTEGLKKMHQKGAYVLGQDEASSVVYGMPRAAFEAGAVDAQLDIEAIGGAVNQVCGLSVNHKA